LRKTWNEYGDHVTELESIVATVAHLRAPSPHFQRAINLKYDLEDVAYLEAYVPTPNTARAISILVHSTLPGASRRATLLYGPYGSGKSLLAVVLAALFSRDERLQGALAPVVKRLWDADPEVAKLVEDHLRSGPRLLTVILSGDEGDLGSVLLRGLTRALLRVGLGDIRPRTHYRAAQETLLMWRRDFPDTYERLDDTLRMGEGGAIDRLRSVDDLQRGLEAGDDAAYDTFLHLYPQLTAGATFNNHYGQSVVDAYRETVAALRADTGYDGIVILWDEFGRFLEARASEAFGREAALLQEFAEFANRSGEAQVHLILITHKGMSGYAWRLHHSDYEKEWARIAERFTSLDVSGDPLVAYHLIAEALTTPNEVAWQAYLDAHRPAFSQMLGQTLEQRLFPALDDMQVWQWIVTDAYPLHPLAVYALPRLSNKVAQNERTLFTFLAGDEPGTLSEHLAAISLDPPCWVGLDVLYDYFAEAMRASIGPGGLHDLWAAAEYALGKTPPDETLSRRLVKSLAVLLAVADGALQPTTSTLVFALGEEREKVLMALGYLSRRKVVLRSLADDSWQFSAGSSVDIEAEVQARLDRRPPTLAQLRRFLEKSLPPETYCARRYNQAHGMVRYFVGTYYTPQDLDKVDWESYLKTTDYADGLIVYVLARDAVELKTARTAIAQRAGPLRGINTRRVIFVVPRQPLLYEDLLRELIALTDLKNDPLFKAQDERVEAELDFFIEDTVTRLRRALASLIDPRQGGADWYYQGELWTRYPIDGPARAVRLLSDICEEVFSRTPCLRNEMLNVREPTGQQVRAAERVIDGFLTDPIPADLGITGYGPDWLILQTILKVPGFLTTVSQDGAGQLGCPADPNAAAVWNEIESFIEQARSEPQSFASLLDALQLPRYGLRRGVLPLLIAAVVRTHLRVTTIRHKGKAVLPITGTTFTALCHAPDEHSLEVGPEDALQQAIWDLLEAKFAGTDSAAESYALVRAEEKRYQPLRYLSLGMIRWLQALPRYARDTQTVSDECKQFRTLIGKAINDPSPVLFRELPTLLARRSPSVDADQDELGVYHDTEVNFDQLKSNLELLMGELEAAYQHLLRRLDTFAAGLFAPEAVPPCVDGRSALARWGAELEARCQRPLAELRFGDPRAEGLASLLRAEVPPGSFWNTLAQKTMGQSPRDWNDRGEEMFRELLREAKAQVEREALGLVVDNDEAVEVSLNLGGEAGGAYRFRQTRLSKQGQRLLEHFKSTMAVSGRPLSPDERRQVALEFLRHMLEDD
jgi:hypothetical protein